jgi:hypothetical protein
VAVGIGLHGGADLLVAYQAFHSLHIVRYCIKVYAGKSGSGHRLLQRYAHWAGGRTPKEKYKESDSPKSILEAVKPPERLTRANTSEVAPPALLDMKPKYIQPRATPTSHRPPLANIGPHAEGRAAK